MACHHQAFHRSMHACFQKKMSAIKPVSTVHMGDLPEPEQGKAANKIYPLGIKNTEDKKIEENSSIWNSVFGSSIHLTLDEADELNDDHRKKRDDEMESIVLHGKCSVSWWHSLWGVLGTVMGLAAAMGGIIMLPTGNVFIDPSYWYECMLQCGILWIGNILV